MTENSLSSYKISMWSFRKPSVPLSKIAPWSEHGASVCARVNRPAEFKFEPNTEINQLVSFLPRGDSTALQIDAIVNAANSGLYAGGGICGAIHSAAGPELAQACHKIGGCPTGGAVITPGFKLPAKHVIHAVGPIGEHPDELESAYKSTLNLMDGENVRSVGLCCISTGIYGYPIKPATEIALRVVREFLEDEENRKKVDRIIFVVFMAKDVEVYSKLLPVYFPLPEMVFNGEEQPEEEEEAQEEEEEEEAQEEEQ